MLRGKRFPKRNSGPWNYMGQNGIAGIELLELYYLNLIG